jgi:uncharacterized metal-binding protein YceD (DUF177 family)
MTGTRSGVSEFHRPVALDRITAHGLDLTLDATTAECAALAARMKLPAVHALSCAFHLIRESRDVVAARGYLRARVTQTCIVSLEDFETDLEEGFQVRFVPSGEETDDIDPESDDEIPFEGNQIDLGEAAAEQLGLALDPYPRMPGAELPAAEVDIELHPFARLAGLRRLN